MRGTVSRTLSRSALALTLSAGLAACATTAPTTGAFTVATAGSSEPTAPSSSRAMPLGAPVEPPVGYVSLCMRSPIDCVHADTPQARAGAVLQARAIARARWQRAIDLAASRGEIEAPPPIPASTGAPQGQAAVALVDASSRPELAPAAAAADAAAPVASDSRIELDPTAWATLKKINAYVNRAIRPADDLKTYGARDWWVAPIASGLAPYGDCKDYVLEKRRELIGAGLPSKAMTIALVRTTWGESHAVLLVATTQGDLVLDNLAVDIRSWDRAPYAWEARQSADDPLVWLAVTDHAGPPVVARRTDLAWAEPRRSALWQ